MEPEDRTTDGDAARTASYTPASPDPRRVAAGDLPTETLPTPDRAATEAGLIYGMLAMIRGLVTPDTLIQSLGVWSRSPGRPLREILLERGHLEEAEARLVDDLASTQIGQHGGATHEALIALGEATSVRLDPDQVTDPELRGLLTALADGSASPQPSKMTRISPRYEIIEHHARGGLGVVSRARDQEIHREVALKEIRDDRAHDPDYRARFLREAEVTGRLEHPGIVPVYGIGHHDDGRPYYIMRFIRGETLRTAIIRLHKPSDDDDEVEPGERHDLHALAGRFIDACQAMAYAHHRKILHRDIKPTNIMLGPFGETLVVDWGLAKSFDGPAGGESHAPVQGEALQLESGSGMTPTMAGSEIGTVGYMSPEQADGRISELAPPSDIYSLGVTLYFLATGHAPFEGIGRNEFLRKVQVGDFPRPSQVNPAISPALEAICQKAMALRPVDRYQTASELANDLERWRAGQPVLAYPEPFVDRLARWAKRHRTPLAGAAVFLICATIGLAVLAEREREENVRIKAERDKADQQRAEAEANRRFALDRLKSTLALVTGADLAFLARSEGLRTRMADELVESYRELLRKAPDDPRTRFDLAQACQLAANLGRLTGKFGRPAELYAEAIRLLESLGDWTGGDQDIGLELAMLHDDAGEYARMMGQPDQAKTEHLKALEALHKPGNAGRAEAVGRRTEARFRIDLAGALLDLGQVGASAEASRRAIELLGPLAAASADRTDRLLLLYASLLKASTSRLGGDFDRAKTELADAERQARTLFASSSDPDTRMALAAVRMELGYALIEANPEGPPGPALKAFEESCSHIYTLYKNTDQIIMFQRSLAAVLVGRGACYLGLKRFEEARSDFTNARLLLEKLDADIPRHFDQLGQLGAALTGLGRVARAESDPETARPLLIKGIDALSAAIELNANGPDLKRLIAEARRELAGLGERPTPAPPRP